MTTTTYENLPARFIDGSPNPDHWREIFRQIGMLNFKVTIGEKDFPKGYNVKQIQDFYVEDARQCGLDAKHLMDVRTEAEKAEDAVKMIMDAPESVLEIADAEIKAVKAAMDKADAVVEEYMKGREKDEIDSGRRPPKAKARLDRARKILDTTLELRARARERVPSARERSRSPYRRASHLLRYMSYIGRSGISRPDEARHKRVYRWGEHHGKISAAIWEAQDGVRLISPDPDCDNNNARCKWKRGDMPYKGAVIVVAPGHGKSEICAGFAARQINDNHRTAGVYLHAKATMAEKSKKYISSYFDRSNEAGRRNYALFPYELADMDNTSALMRLDANPPIKQPTLEAAGVKSKSLGTDTLWQIKDDIVPQSDRDEDEERTRRHALVSGTWDTRQRGEHAFDLVVGTLWHYDDVLARMIQQARKGKLMYRVCVTATGGPYSTPKFKSVWPEVYPAKELEARYRRMNDPVLWSAAYMADPSSSQTRIVKKLAFYDPSSSDHVRFLADSGTERHISADPAATSRAKSDKAGLVYLAHGSLSGAVVNESVSSVHRIRILDASQFHATQSELTDTIASYAYSHRVDYCHVETVGGFAAMREMLENKFGIDAVPHTTGNMNKERRLKGVAAMLEDGNADINAVVEFPGAVVEDESGKPVVDKNGCKKIGPDPRYSWLYRQVLDFGVVSDDHCLDALTQVLKYLAPVVGIGEGEVTASVRRVVHNPANRKREFLRAVASADTANITATEEECGYFSGVHL